MLTLRAVRSRTGQSLALFALGVVVVAGCVVAVGYGRATSGTVAPAGALLLLGVVALAAQGAASGRRRRYEIALAQLHGRSGLRLLRVAVAEPVVILAGATVVGTCAGWLVARAAVQRWIGGAASFEMATAEWLTAAGVLVVSIVVVVAVTWRATYEPLNDKLRDVERPRRATAVGLFLSLLVLLGAVVSVFQARQLGVKDANWVSYVSPALLGLAAGQIGSWLVALTARVAAGSARLNRRIGWFLTLRRLTRASDSVAVMRVVVAAVVVAGVAGSAWVGAQSWRDSTARMQTGGPVTYDVPAGALQAYAASHAADPQGNWLMAVSAAPGSGGSYRDVFVDTPRWDRVAGSFFAGTPLEQVSQHVKNLLPMQLPAVARGEEFTVTFTASSVRASLPSPREVRRIEFKNNFGHGFAPLAFTVTYVDSQGGTQTLTVPKRPQERPQAIGRGVVGYSAPIRAEGSRALACARACSVTRVDVRGLTLDSPLRVTGMSFGGLQLVPITGDGLTPRTTRSAAATPSEDGLDLQLRDPYTAHPFLAWKRADVAAALATPGLRPDRSRGKPLAYGLDGEPRSVEVVAEVPALPVLGREGLLLDLGTALRGAGGQISAGQTFVVARADTPTPVLTELEASGAVGKERLVSQALEEISRGDTAQGTLLYMLIAGFCLVIAALSVVSAVGEQRRARRREAAALRVVGVGSETVAQGYRGEAEALGIAVAAVAAGAVWVGCRALLDVLPLVDTGEFGLLFDPAPRLGLVAGIAVGAGLGVALVVFLGLRLVGQSSPPRLLREEA